LPLVTISIILLCLLMFAVQLIGGEPVTYGWSLIPKEIVTGQDIVGPVSVAGETIQLYAAPLGIVYLTLLTSMFMHGGLLHLLSNMLFLFIFGDNVEYRFGPGKYLAFYLMCGFGAEFVQVLMGGADVVVPNLGASGAIAGVMAAYVIMFPLAKVRGVIPLGRFSTVATVPAFVMIGLWMLSQIVSVSLLGEQSSDVAYWAHIGGFIAGLVLTLVFRPGQDVGTASPSFSGR
jgi:membrane associated rhomboid family serine protease